MTNTQNTASGPVPRRRPAPMRAEVRRVEQRSQNMRRIVFGGAELGRFVWPGPASHLKLLLPRAGQRSPSLPTPGPDGTVQFDRSSVIMRTYTPRAWDSEAAELAIDVFLHGDGPASAWARQAETGHQVGLSQPRANYLVESSADWLMLAGDESAVPAISTIVEACASSPAGTTTPIVLIESDGDDTDLGLAPGSAQFVTRMAGSPGHALLTAMADAWPSGEGRVWVAGEAQSIRTIRSFLLRDQKMAPTSVVTRGYWKLGEADHPDHDHGDD